jgi:hypothetical protein
VPFVFASVSSNPARTGRSIAHQALGRVQRLRNIERHPAVEVVVDDYDEDWTALWWVRASGTAASWTREERSTALW